MNKDGVLVQLAEYLGAFRCHANLFGEIAGIVAKSGYERNFFALLVVQLHILYGAGEKFNSLCRLRVFEAFRR